MVTLMTFLPTTVLKHILDYAFPYYQQYELKDITNALLDTITQVNIKGEIQLDAKYYRGVSRDNDKIIKTLYKLAKFGISIFPKLNEIVKARKEKANLLLKDRNHVETIKKKLRNKANDNNTEFRQMFQVNDIIVYYKCKQTWTPTITELGWVKQPDGKYKTNYGRGYLMDSPNPTQLARICYTRQVYLESKIAHKNIHHLLQKYPPSICLNDITLDHQKVTIFYRIVKVNKKSYNIQPMPMCLRLYNSERVSRNLHLYQYRLTPSDMVNNSEQYRLDHTQIIFDKHKLEITGSKYPSITKYDDNHHHHALYQVGVYCSSIHLQLSLDRLKTLYHVSAE
jgi:hypothetical protein